MRPVTGIDKKCLANQNGLNTEGNPIDARACSNSSGQRWSAYSDRTLRTEGGCLDVVGGGTGSGTDVDWYACNGTAAQVWTREANGELLNPKWDYALTDPDGNPDSDVRELQRPREVVAQQRDTDMPASSSGRMYFYLGSPAAISTSSSSRWAPAP